MSRSGLLKQKADVAEQAGRRHGHNGHCRALRARKPDEGKQNLLSLIGSMPSPRSGASDSDAVKGAMWGEKTDGRQATARKGERTASSRLLSFFEQVGQVSAICMRSRCLVRPCVLRLIAV